MGWGAMMGLGEAFTNIGRQLDEDNKIKLRDKLESERELAREGRQEARDKKAVVGQPKLKGDTWEHYNKYGDVVKTRTATLDELKELGNAQRLQAAQTRSAEATATTAETELSWATQDRELLSPEQRALSAKIKAGLALSAAEQEQARRWGMDYAQKDRHHKDNVNARGIEGRLSDPDAGMAQSVEAAVEQARDAGLPEAIIQRLRSQATGTPTTKKLPKGGTVNIKPTPEQANIAFIELLNEELQKSYGAGNKGLVRGKPGAVATE